MQGGNHGGAGRQPVIDYDQDPADDVVCLDAPVSFRAVSQVYEHFEQVDDEEVLDMLRDAD